MTEGIDNFAPKVTLTRQPEVDQSPDIHGDEPRGQEAKIVNFPFPSASSLETIGGNETHKYTTVSEMEELARDGDDRGQWSNQIEFLLSCISMSVGLGNLWRFPVMAYENGGGAFLIPYLVVLMFVGRPIYFMELCLGQFSSKSQVKVWRCCPILKGVGYSAMIATLGVMSYYTSIMSLILYYFVDSFRNPLPWTRCAAAQPNCKSQNISTAESHMTTTVLHQKHDIRDGIGSPDWKLTLYLLAAWLMIYGALIKGVKSSGKVAYFTAIFPYLVLITLLIRGVTLPGAWQGIVAFVYPDLHKLYDPKVWYLATSQCFFSLNTGFGSVIMFGSYNPIKHNIYRDAIILSFTDTITSLIAGVTVFSVMGYLAGKTGKNIHEILHGGGAGLAFIAYPTAVAEFPCPQFFAVSFFLMLFALGLGSAAADAGAVIALISDKYPEVKRWKIATAICVGAFLLGSIYVTPGGQFILNLVDMFCGAFVIFLTSILEVIGVFWIYGMNNFLSDIEFMLDRKLGWYWKICWGGVIPVGLSFALIYSVIQDLFNAPLQFQGVPYPVTAVVSGWMLAILCLSPLAICAVQVVLSSKSVTFMGKLRDAIKPKRAWGPMDHKFREEWKEFKKQQGRA